MTLSGLDCLFFWCVFCFCWLCLQLECWSPALSPVFSISPQNSVYPLLDTHLCFPFSKWGLKNCDEYERDAHLCSNIYVMYIYLNWLGGFRFKLGNINSGTSILWVVIWLWFWNKISFEEEMKAKSWSFLKEMRAWVMDAVRSLRVSQMTIRNHRNPCFVTYSIKPLWWKEFIKYGKGSFLFSHVVIIRAVYA